ncbi:MAG: TOMM precursor leader peptide-binding protein [Pseudomonadota bacterium]|jgi:ribosomal protein S12 methylthiotransferase accessory factor
MTDARPLSFVGAPSALVEWLSTSAAVRADGDQAAMNVVVRHNSARHFGEAWARRARQEGLSVLHLGVDADRLVLGPRWDGDRGGCLGCLHAWMREPWSAAFDSGDDRQQANLMPPWPHPALQIVGEMIDQAVRQSDMTFVDAAVIVDWRTGVCRPHRFVSHPDCRVCGTSEDRADWIAADIERARTVGATYRERALTLDTAALRATFLDDTSGFIRSLNATNSPLLHPMSFAGFLRDTEPPSMEVGVGRTGVAALDGKVAILEAFERFVGFRPRGDRRRISASYEALGARAIDPRAFVLSAPEQAAEPAYLLTPYDPAAVYDWVPAYSWRQKKEVLIPEQVAYYDLEFDAAARASRFIIETSNGCALGSSYGEATLFGLCEVLERDAYLTSWYGQFAPIRLDLSDYPDPYIQALVARMEGVGLEVNIFDIGVGLPVSAVACVAVDRSPQAAIKTRTAAGASLNPTQAISAALVEVCSNVIEMEPEAVEELHRSGAAMLQDPSLVRTMADHTSLYAHPDALPRLDFMIRTPHVRNARQHFATWLDRVPPFDLSAELNRLADAVLGISHDLLIIDQGFGALDALGINAVKVLAPGLMPMSFGHQYRRIAHKRLETAAAARGRNERVPATFLPHNFP